MLIKRSKPLSCNRGFFISIRIIAFPRETAYNEIEILLITLRGIRDE